MLIVYSVRGGGWHPVTYMAHLARECFDAELLELPRSQVSAFRKLDAILSRRNGRGQEVCLVICPAPTDLLSLMLVSGWKKRFRRVIAWVFDSFWIDHIPRTSRLSRPFDELFITTEEDIPAWEQCMRTPTHWLPWGTDVMRLGAGGDAPRSWDLLRVGRQPPEWDCDETLAQASSECGLRFHGRPPMFPDAESNQRALMQFYAQSKFLLSFSNRVNPTNYTHPQKEYITARWVDALACGTTVAGIAPRSSSVEKLLWPGATLEFESLSREEGLRQLHDAARAWEPRQAAGHYRQALERLDWRWRFEALAGALEIAPPPLQKEMQQLRDRIDREDQKQGQR